MSLTANRRNDLLHTSARNVTALKADIRQKYKEWKKGLRHKAVSQNRRYTTETADEVREILMNLRSALQDGVDDLEGDYIDSAFKEVEEELLRERIQFEAQLYEHQLEDELNNVVERHTSVCTVCNQTSIELNYENAICTSCVHDFLLSST